MTMSTTQIDAELKAAKQDVSKFRQSRVNRDKHLERVLTEAVNNKYHGSSKKACPVYANFKKAGFSNVVADSMCRQAHRYGINPNLSPGTIINILKARDAQVGFKPNSTNSKQTNPDPSQIQDKQYTISNYESVDDCINNPMTGLVSLGVESSRARQECESYFADKLSDSDRKTVGGNSWYKTAAKNASVSNNVPYWATVSNIDTSHLHNVTTTNIKSAAQQNDDALYNYIIAQQYNHKDSVNYVEPNLEMERLVEKRGRELDTINKIRRIRSGAVEKEDNRPAWAIVSSGF